MALRDIASLHVPVNYEVNNTICWNGCNQSAFKWKFADMAVSSQLSSGKILLIWLYPVSFQVEMLLIWLYPVSFQVEKFCWYGCVQSAFKWKFCWYGCTQSAFKWRIIAVQIIIPKQQSPTAAQHISTAMETVKQTLKRLLTFLAEFRLLCEKWFCQFIKSLISILSRYAKYFQNSKRFCSK